MLMTAKCISLFFSLCDACPVLQAFSDQVDALQIWRFKDWVKDQLEPVMEELHEMPAPRMAFHIRGGDKLSEDVQLVRRTPLCRSVHVPQAVLTGPELQC